MNIAPVSGVVAVNAPQPGYAVQGAVATDLPNAAVVTPAATTNAVPTDVSQSDAASLTQRYTIDPQTREVIYRVVDTRTQQVIQQVPDQALLRSRAYSNAIQNGASPLVAQIQADLET